MNIKDRSLIFQKKYIPGDIFKQAPVAYAPIYMETEMKGHSGRMEYRAETLCCNEPVSGSDYGHDEECPCCHKPICWDKDGTLSKAYERSIQDKIDAENAADRIACKTRLRVEIERLSKDVPATREGIAEFVKKVRDLLVETPEPLNVHSPRIISDDKTCKSVSTVYNLGDDHKLATMTLTIAPDFISVTAWEYSKVVYRDEDGKSEWEYERYETPLIRETVDISLPFVSEYLKTVDTPEVVETRQLEQKLSKLGSKGDFAEVLETTCRIAKLNEKESLNGISNAVQKALTIKGYKDIDFEHDGSNWAVYFPEVKKEKAEDGTDCMAYRMVLKESGKLPEGIDGIPESMVLLSTKTRREIPDIVSLCREGVKIPILKTQLENNPPEYIPADTEKEGAFTFIQPDILNQMVCGLSGKGYDLYEEISADRFEEISENEYTDDLIKEAVEDGEIFLEALLDDNDRVHITIGGESDLLDISGGELYLTPTENEILLNLIGDEIRESMKEAEELKEE